MNKEDGVSEELSSVETVNVLTLLNPQKNVSEELSSVETLEIRDRETNLIHCFRRT